MKAAQVKLLYAQSGIGSLGAGLGAVILGYGLWKVVSHDRIIVWLLAYVALSLFRYCLIRGFHRQERDEEAVIKWGTWHTLAVSAGGMMWGVAGVWLFPQNSISHQFLLSIFIAGIAAAASVIYSPTKDYAPNLLLALLPLSCRFIYEFDEFHVTIGCAILLFAGVLLLTGRKMHRVYADSLRLRYDKEELVEDLRDEIAQRDRLETELKIAGNNLEVRVEERTAALKNLNRKLEREIIERTLAQEELRKSEEKYRLLAENATDIVWTLDLKTLRLTYISPSVEKIRGYRPAEAIELPLDKGLAPDSYTLAMTELTEELGRDRDPGVNRERIRLLEFQESCKDGSIISTEVRIKFLRDVNGLPTGLLGITRDVTERKRMEEKVRDSDARLWDLYDNAPNAYFSVGADGLIRRCNRGAEELLGYSRDQLKGKPFLDSYIYGPRGKEKAAKVFQKSISWEHVSSQEIQMQKADGSPIWVSLSVKALRDAQGKVMEIRCAVVDITERKEAQEALRVSEEQYRAVFDNAGIGIDLLDRDGRIVKANKALSDMLGYPEKELRELTFLELTYPDDREISKRNLEALMAGKTDSYRLEKRYVKKDGSVVWADLWTSVVRDANGGHMGAVAVIEDITQRKLAQHALQESDEKYRTLFEDSIDALFMMNADGTLIDANQAYFDLLGYEKGEIVGHSVFKTYAETVDPKRYHQTLGSREFVRDYPLRLVRKDQRQIDCLVSSRVESDKDGNILGYRGFIRDITEQKNLQNQLLQAQKMEAVGTLAGGIAHDFNNLLTIVIGFSELLLAEKDEEHPDHADLQKIFHAAVNGADLVQRLLMFSRKSEPKPVPMNLNKQIVQVERLLRRTIPKMINIRLDLSSDLPDISADTSQIEQVLMNLTVNARDAMPDNGTLSVRTQAVTLNEDYCRFQVGAKPGEYVLLEVSDTGHGMDKETVQHIFEPFFTTKGIGRGTGLGLAMVYGIVTQHDGHITINSEVGKGTTFRIYLPAIPPDLESGVADSGVMPALGTETLLLVDDEEFVRELGARILTKQGYTVLQAVNGREALDLFKKERSRISLVILDLIMPEMSGTECLKELLNIDHQVNVLITSGLSAETSVKETIQMGAKRFVTKPFRVKELLRDVRKVLDES